MERKTGRPPKGQRAPTVALKLPLEHAPVYEACAKELGLPIGDFIGMVMAQVFASGAASDAERAHFGIPSYITAQIAAKRERDAQEALLDREEATQAA
jgi:hypothetical protein